MREWFSNLTVNQMIALIAATIAILLIAAVLFSISEQEPDPFSIPTATLPINPVTEQFEFRPATRAP